MTNPFDQFDSAPVAAAPAASATPATPATPAASGNAFDQFDHQEVAAPTQKPKHHDQILTAMYVNHSSDSSIRNYIDQNQVNVDQGDLDYALKYRKRYGRVDNFQGFVDMGGDTKPKPEAAPKPQAPQMSVSQSVAAGMRSAIPAGDRIGAAVDGVAGAIRGDGYTDTYDKSLADRRAQGDAAWDQHPLAYGSGMAAGIVPQLALGTGEASLAGTVLRGAGQAGLYSLGDTHQDLTTAEGWQQAGTDAAKDAAIGGTLGATLHGVAAVAGKISPTGYSRAAIETADRLGVDPNLATVGGPVSRALSGIAQNVPILGRPVQKALDRTVSQAGNKLARTADTLAQDAGQAGPMTLNDAAARLTDENVSGSLAAYGPSGKAALGPQYDVLGKAVGAIDVAPTRAVAGLDDAIKTQTSKFRGEKDASWLPEIKDIRDDLAAGKIPFNSLREYRTSVRGRLQSKLGDNWRNMSPGQRGEIEGVLDDMYKNVTRDLHGALRSNGLLAESTTLRGVDRQYAKISETEKALKPFLDLSPEQLGTRLESLAKDRNGNSDDLSMLMKTLGPQERANVQAAFVSHLGLPNAGAANGQSFSPNSFLTRWGGNDVNGGLSSRAKDLLFTGQTRRDLDDLADLSKRMRKYYSETGNPSGTGRLVIAYEEAKKVLGFLTTGGASLTVPMTAAAGFSGAALLASPRFARLVVNLGQKGRAFVPQAARQLEYMARRTPAQAAQFLGIRDILLGGPNHSKSVPVQGNGSTDNSSQEDHRSGFDQEQHNPDDPAPIVPDETEQAQTEEPDPIEHKSAFQMEQDGP